MSDQDTEALCRAAFDGSKIAVDELLERYLPGLVAFLRLRAGKSLQARESVSDLAQSVCREVLEHIERFQYQGEAGFKHWLYTTALRKIANRNEYYRAAKRDAAREQTVAGSGSSSTPEGDLLQCYGSFCTPSRQAIAREELKRIELAFEKLPEQYREVILLSRIVGLSHADIAQRMDRTEGAVRTLLSRALAQLAELLEEDSGDG